MFTERIFTLVFVILVLMGCQRREKARTKFHLLLEAESGVGFSNIINEADLNVLDYVNMYNGAGIGIGDFDNDGFQDIFFGGNLVSSKLYLNNGKAASIKFSDVTEVSGTSTDKWVNGISVVDVNQDGHDDIYCSVSGGGGWQGKGKYTVSEQRCRPEWNSTF